MPSKKSRIKIDDLPQDARMALTEDDMRKVAGGAVFAKYDGIDGESLRVETTTTDLSSVRVSRMKIGGYEQIPIKW